MADTPITWTDVTDLIPDMVDVEVPAQDAILDWVNSFLNPAMFTEKNLKKARIYLAAHVGTFSLPGGSDMMGPVTSESVGGISRTYSDIAAATNGDGFDQTTFGTLYVMLLRTSKARLPRVI